MQRVYLVYQVEIYEKPIFKAAFESYSAAKQATKNLDEIEGPTHVVECHQVFKDVNAMRKRKEKRLLAKKLMWLRTQLKRSFETLPYYIAKEIRKYKNKNLL